MKWLALISILANLALADVLLRPRPAGPGTLPAESPVAAAASTIARTVTNQVEVLRTITNAAPPFSWSLVESEEYLVYMANLRRLECPEWLVRELVLADLMRHYRLRALDLPEAKPAHWLTHEQQRARVRRQAEAQWALKLEERSVMLQLTGTYRQEDAMQALKEKEFVFTFGALTDDQVLEAISEFVFLGEHKKHFEELYHQLLSPTDLQQLDAEYDAIKDRLSARLSPALFEEFWLRLEVLLGSMINELEIPGVQLTGSQLRELVRIRSGIIDPLRWELIGAGKPEDDDQKQLDTEVQRALDITMGGQVASQYARSQDPVFRSVHELTERHQLPVASAIAVYDIRQAAIDEARAFLASNEIDGARKRELRRQIQLDTEKAVRTTLGPDAWKDYRQGEGRWLDRIGGQPPDNNPGGRR